MKFENKCKKLGVTEEVENLLANCELYDEENDPLTIVELSKLRNWEIQEHIGNYFEWIDKEGNEVECDNYFYCRLTSLCKTFGIAEEEIANYYAKAICNEGYQIAYALESNEDTILIIGR